MPFEPTLSLPWFKEMGEDGIGGVEFSLSDGAFLYLPGMMSLGMALTSRYECQCMMLMYVFIESKCWF